MAYPTSPPVLSQTNSIRALMEAEAGIAQCAQELLCDLAGKIKTYAGTDLEDAVHNLRTVILAFSCKEKAMGKLIKATAMKEYAEQGLLPPPGCISCDNK